MKEHAGGRVRTMLAKVEVNGHITGLPTLTQRGGRRALGQQKTRQSLALLTSERL